jgi:hypothetical protein
MDIREQSATRAKQPHLPETPRIEIAAREDLPWIRSEWVTAVMTDLGDHRSGYYVEDRERRKGVMRNGEFELAGLLLDRSQAIVMKSGSRLVGFLVRDLELPIIHFAFVVRDARQTGLARRMIQEADLGTGWKYTRETRVGRLVFQKLGGLFDPYLANRLLRNA